MEINIKLGVEVRNLQQKCKLSSLQASHVASLLEEHTQKKPNLRGADRELARQCGVQLQILNGCVGCDDHVFEQQDRAAHCPKCGASRYKDDGKTPQEIVYYFPLAARMKALLELPNFVKMLEVFTVACILFM